MNKQGKLYKGQNGLYTVAVGDDIFMCHAASRIRKENGIKLLAGDDVVITDNGDGTGFIESVLPRKNSFIRPAVANVDLVVVVAAGDSPKPSVLNIDKMCCVAESKGADVMLVFTKSDLGGTDELLKIYKKTPYKCFAVGKNDYGSLPEIKSMLVGRHSVLAGASGVGKSTLLNALFADANAETGELSRKIMRGKNTTRVTEMFAFGGCMLTDSPGFGLLDYERCLDADKHDLINLFPEMLEYALDCRFTKCTHTKELGCAVIEAVNDGTISPERHQSYCSLYEVAKTLKHYNTHCNT